MQAEKDKSGLFFLSGLDFVSRWCAYIGAVLLSIMAAIITYDVVMRKFFARPTMWAIDFSEYIMAYATFLGAAWLLGQDGHIKIGILYDDVKPAWQRVLTYFGWVVGFIVSIIILWQSSLATWDAYSRHIVIPRPVAVPKFAVLIEIPFMSILLALYFAINVIYGIRGKGISEIHQKAEAGGGE